MINAHEHLTPTYVRYMYIHVHLCTYADGIGSFFPREYKIDHSVGHVMCLIRGAMCNACMSAQRHCLREDNKGRMASCCLQNPRKGTIVMAKQMEFRCADNDNDSKHTSIQIILWKQSSLPEHNRSNSHCCHITHHCTQLMSCTSSRFGRPW